MIRPRPTTPLTASVILVGPDPAIPRGGVAVAMGGFEAALRDHGLLDQVIRSYAPGHRARYLPTAALAIRRAVHKSRAEGRTPIVWAHAGGPLSVARKAVMLRVARACGARTLLQLHSVHTEGLVTRRRSRALTRRALSAADDITCVAPYWQRLVARELGRDRVHVLSNPLPAHAEEMAQRAHRPQQDEPLRLLSLTHLAEGKGLELAIEALSLGPEDSTLEIGGVGPLRERLERQVRSLGLGGRVRFLGWVEGAEKHAALERAHAFVLPTQYDSFGMGFVEAAAYGLPSVALRYKAVPEVVLHGQTGRLVDTPDAGALAGEFRRLTDPTERDRLGRAARERAVHHHGRSAIITRLTRILEASC